MAGEIQLNSTTFATESGGTITVSNVDSATNRTNLGLGSIATQASDSIDINGGAIDGVTLGTNSAVTDLRVDNLKLDANTISSTDVNGNINLTPNGTGSVVVSNFASTGIDDNASTTALTIDSSGYVGIGTGGGTIDARLHVQGPANTTNNTDTRNVIFRDPATNQGALEIRHGYSTNSPNNRYTSFQAWSNEYTNSVPLLLNPSGSSVLIGYTSSNGSYKLQVNSQIFATSATIATSDGRYKENITPLDSVLNLVTQLNPVQFDWKEHPVHQFDREQPTVGFIAQEVQEVLADKAYKNSIIKSNTTVITPEELDEDGNVITAEVTEEFLGIAEGNLVAILTKAIQEQQTLIESQQSQINVLTARIVALETT